MKWKHCSATSSVPLISELFTLFLVFSTPLALPSLAAAFLHWAGSFFLLIATLSEAVKSLERVWCYSGSYVMQGARIGNILYHLQFKIKNSLFTLCMCFNTYVVRVKHTNWTFSSMGTEMTLLPPRFQKD